ncbi:hypothetical protein [Spirillospora sp. NPDC047279]|uniref:hypothetical protein n=1 Tax=Spirillospora sp. NPDC047279 TaxID=3155478 RepID=UPI0033D63017
MIATVAVFSLVAAAVCLVVGAFSAFGVRDKRREVIAAIRVPSIGDDASAGMADRSLAATFDSVARLAAALKDLDRVAQMFTLALGFTAVAALAVGIDAIARAAGG